MTSSSDRQTHVPIGSARAIRLPLVRTPLQGPYTAMYGSDVVAARYCGFRRPPAPPDGLWMHGWYPERRRLDRPERLFDVTMGHLKELRYWVTTERQADFLRGLGFSHAKAIGLPLAYVPEAQVDREENSLLVMPAHSLPANDRAWATEEYVAAIAEIRPAFSRARVVINGHDWDRGNWIGEFRRAGFEVVRGAGDSGTLERMATLFSQFEYVTTNGFGSLIAYASACGAKASFYGPFSEVTPDSLRHIPFFVDNPELIEAEVADLKESHCRETFPEFFCHPAEAEERTAWGRGEIGQPRRVSPDELRALFGWSPAGRAKWKGRDLAARARAAVPQPVKAQLKERATAEGRSRRRERTRLESMAAGVPGTTTLFGAPFAFSDAADHLRAYEECFVAHVYRFGARSRRPLVVDGDAGCGLAVLYFKCLYPEGRVIAFEPDETAFGLLGRNCHAYGLHDVDLVHGTLSAQERLIPPDPLTGSGPPGGRIDMLKLGVDASQAHDLGRLAGLIAAADHVALDYRGPVGEPQAIGSVFEILSDAGLRVAVQAPDAALARPLVELPSSRSRVLRLRILGFRV